MSSWGKLISENKDTIKSGAKVAGKGAKKGATYAKENPDQVKKGYATLREHDDDVKKGYKTARDHDEEIKRGYNYGKENPDQVRKGIDFASTHEAEIKTGYDYAKANPDQVKAGYAYASTHQDQVKAGATWANNNPEQFKYAANVARDNPNMAKASYGVSQDARVAMTTDAYASGRGYCSTLQTNPRTPTRAPSRPMTGPRSRPPTYVGSNNSFRTPNNVKPDRPCARPTSRPISTYDTLNDNSSSARYGEPYSGCEGGYENDEYERGDNQHENYSYDLYESDKYTVHYQYDERNGNYGHDDNYDRSHGYEDDTYRSNYDGQDAENRYPPEIPDRPPVHTIRKFAKALYDFEGEEDGDLSFKKGDSLLVTHATWSRNHWWVGEHNGEVGYFPGTYVNVLKR
eukprot:CFRG2829T1